MVTTSLYSLLLMSPVLQNYFHQLIPTSLWVWLTGHHNRASRQRHLTTGIRQPEVGLFARKPRRSSVAVAAIPGK